jgi:dihydroxyacetone kinase-like protein
MTPEKTAPPKPISSLHVAWEEWSEVPRFSVRYRHLTPCCGRVPAVGPPTFELGDHEIEMGVGIHGEPGRRRIKLKCADAIAAAEMIDAIIGDLGGTPSMELYLMYRAARTLLEKTGVTVRSLVGNYVTSLEMAGCSLTVTLLDSDLLKLWDAPVHTAALGAPT